MSMPDPKPSRKKSAGAPAVASDGAGVVSYYLKAPLGRAAARGVTSARLIKFVRSGLPVQELRDLQAGLGVPMDKLVPMLGLSKATLHRRKVGGKLEPAESDRVVRFARLLGRAIGVLESGDNARRWLTSPQVGLGGAVPLYYADTEVGAREVEDLLGRIEYGVYS